MNDQIEQMEAQSFNWLKQLCAELDADCRLVIDDDLEEGLKKASAPDKANVVISFPLEIVDLVQGHLLAMHRWQK